MERIETMKKFDYWLIDGFYDTAGAGKDRYCGYVVAKDLDAAKALIAEIEEDSASGLGVEDFRFEEAGETDEPAGV